MMKRQSTPRNLPDLETLQAICDAWNAKHPVGTLVDYSSVIGEKPTFQGKTRCVAYVLSGHTPVVFLEGKSGCVALEAVKAVGVEAA